MPGASSKFVNRLSAIRASASFKIVGGGLANDAGMSLLEVLFGIAIVGVAAVGMAMMFGMGQSMVQGGGDNRAALSIAQQRLEQVRAAGFGPDGLHGQPALPDPREESGAQGVPINNFSDSDAVPGFRRRTIITGVCATNFAIAYNDGDCPTGPNVEAKLVTVMVRMMDPGGTNTDVQTLPVVLSTVLVKK
jgi:prepilin-type N-terminal cleavage/methylation domain-containing protein